jgi:hypothetical protein
VSSKTFKYRQSKIPQDEANTIGKVLVLDMQQIKEAVFQLKPNMAPGLQILFLILINEKKNKKLIKLP